MCPGEKQILRLLGYFGEKQIPFNWLQVFPSNLLHPINWNWPQKQVSVAEMHCWALGALGALGTSRALAHNPTRGESLLKATLFPRSKTFSLLLTINRPAICLVGKVGR